LFFEGGVLPRFNPVAVDLRALGVTAGVAVAISLALGVLPASRLRADVSGAELRAGTSSPDKATGRLRAVLLVLQVAVTTVLLMCAGVLARGYLRLATADPGFDLRGAVTMTLGLPSNVSVRQDEELRQFYVQLLDRVAALPGVRAAGGINALPLAGQGVAGNFVIDGDPALRGTASYRVASAGYFPALGIPLMRGRLFEPSDSVDGAHVAVISESLARTTWPGEDPIGRRVQFTGLDGDRRPLNIVGVVADVKNDGLDADPRPTVYAYSLQRPQWWQVSRLAVVIRTDQDPATLVPALRAEVERLRPDVPLQFRTLREVASASLTPRRFSLVLFGVFAVTALAIAGLGVFAAVSYAVSQRTRELAIRTALGATRGRLVAAVLRHGLAFVAGGLVAGFAGALLATRLIANLVYGARVVDVATFAAVALLLLAVAAAACWLPARRASAVDPMAAIRGD
jgi:predicted permease